MNLRKTLCILTLATMLIASTTAYAGYITTERGVRGQDYCEVQQNSVAKYVAYGDEDNVYTAPSVNSTVMDRYTFIANQTIN